MTIADITAWAGQGKIVLQRRGLPVSYDLIHRAKIEIFISDDQLDQVLKTIIETTRSGKPEDGIVTVSNLEQIINIFTLQEGKNACVFLDSVIIEDPLKLIVLNSKIGTSI